MADFRVIPEAILVRAKAIKLVIFDVDGVMTDGGLTIGDDGQEQTQGNRDVQGRRGVGCDGSSGPAGQSDGDYGDAAQRRSRCGARH